MRAFCNPNPSMQPPKTAGALQLYTHLHRGLEEKVLEPLRLRNHVHPFGSLSDMVRTLDNLSLSTLPDVLLVEVEDGAAFEMVARLRSNRMLKDLIVVLLAREENSRWEAQARNLHIQDYYVWPFDVDDLEERLHFLVELRAMKPGLEGLVQKEEAPYVGTPVMKRLFDVVFASLLILLLSPVFLIVALAVRLEGKGPIIYRSKRVGNGYKIFDFYKFRSMRPDADRFVAELAKEHNQYAGDGTAGTPAFTKFKNDPRITRLGRFLRKTSIDELPQLFNILKGDMSAVGNRPLPLYEAEQLTANEWSWRFLAPAGLTGLWQVSRRGGSEMSETERKELDNYYAKNHSMALDAKILFKTFSAIIQKENV